MVVLNFELINLENVENQLLQQYSCSKNDRRLESYLKTDAAKDTSNLMSQTHVLLDKTTNNIVGYFTLSFNWMRFQRKEKEQLKIGKLNHYKGDYPTVILNFFGIDDRYKGKIIGGTDIKYSTLLMFYFISESYTVLKKIPFSIIMLKSYKETKDFYTNFEFTYIRQTNEEETYYQYILPANRLDNLLDIENNKTPFTELFNLMSEPL